MLVLFETCAGFALFKVLDEGKLSQIEVLFFFIFFLLCFEIWVIFCLMSELIIHNCFVILFCRICGRSSLMLIQPKRS